MLKTRSLQILRLLRPALIVAPAIALSACTSVPVYKQIQVSKAGMTFSDSLLDSGRINIASQIEPGIAVSGGAEGAGCTACQ